MAYLGKITEQLETTFSTSVHGKYHIRTEIEGLRFYSTDIDCNTAHSQNLLYIGYASDISPTVLPKNLLLIGYDGDTMDAQVLFIREKLNIAEVFNTIQEVIFKHYTVKLKREELFLSLHNNNGIAGLAHVAHTFLNNPITICDTSFSVIAASPAVKDTRHLEEKHGRLYLKDHLFQDMADRNIIKHIYTSTTPYITMLQDYPYKWVFESIRIHHAVVGYICVRGTVREFTEDDLEFIDVFAQMLSVEMQKDAAYSHPTGLKYEYFLTELLEGHFDRTEYISSHLIQLGRSQMPFYTILLLKFTDSSRKPSQYKGYFEQLLSLLPNCMVVLFRGDLTILMPSEAKNPFTEKCLNRFSAFLQLNHMQAFVSYPYTDISKSSIYYQQTKDLSVLYEKNLPAKEENLIYYEHYFLEHEFYQCTDTRLLAASVHPNIEQLIEYDHVNHTEYARTLRIYLANNRNALASAKELHIHKSTFFYRLGKMTDLFDINPNEELELFAYEYSFRVLEYLGIVNAKD